MIYYACQSQKILNGVLVLHLLSDAAEPICTLEKYLPFVEDLPMCEDEATKVFYLAAALAEPKDEFTLADSSTFWSECKGKIWLYASRRRHIEHYLISISIISSRCNYDLSGKQKLVTIACPEKNENKMFLL